MPIQLSPETARQLATRVNYFRDMGIFDFYRRTDTAVMDDLLAASKSASSEVASSEAADEAEVETASSAIAQNLPVDSSVPTIRSKAGALKVIREDIGDCKRCRLHEHRTNIVFGVGNLNADLMFVGEGPGADEDARGEPFVGRAGQLLNNMITAMGIRREDVYIANVVKCRPPGNRTPEPDECDTCSPFLLRQIEVVKPKVIVALGLTAAKNLLLVNDSLGRMRGRWYDFKDARLAVTYHPAYLLRDPRQKAEAWKDLQMVMKFLGLQPPPKASSET